MLGTGKILKTVGRHFRATLVAGVLVIVPVVVTVVILRFVFEFFDGLLQPVVEKGTDYAVPGMGVAALVLVIYLAGLGTTHVLGRRLIEVGHALVEIIPGVRAVYRTARQATGVFSAVSSNGNFTGVVLVDFPGHGLKSIGLVTSRLKDQEGKTLLAVYMPTSPFPTSGFLVFLPEDQVTPIDMPVDDAMKLIVSAGIIAPEKIISNPDALKGVPPSTGSPVPTEGQTGLAHDSDSSASNQ